MPGVASEGHYSTGSAQSSRESGYSGQNQDLRVSIIFHCSICSVVGPEEEHQQCR